MIQQTQNKHLDRKGLVIAFVMFSLVVGTCYKLADNRSRIPANAHSNASNAEPYKYSIVGTRDISYINTPRKVFEVKLDTSQTPTTARMKATANKIWKSESSGLKEGTVFMIFGEIKDFKSGAYGIAEFNQTGMKEFSINDTPLRMIKLRKEGAFDGL